MTHSLTPIDPQELILHLADPFRILDWSTVFGNDGPVELEIGSGKGLFLQNAGTREPSHNFVGVELAKKYAKKGAERAAKFGLRNVRVWPGDAKIFLEKCVRPASLQAVHIYFPDPWWKARHKKRRVISNTLVDNVEKGLKPNGRFWIATDVEEYFEQTVELMKTKPAFRQLEWEHPTSVQDNTEPDYLTNFERKYRIEGRPIFRVLYVKDFDQPDLR